MFVKLLICLVALHLTAAYRLSPEENEHLQRTCGRREFGRKIINGDERTPEQFPFAASVNINGTLSASVISPRHVILFNIVERHADGELTLFDDMRVVGDGMCIGKDFEMWYEFNRIIKVNFVKKQDYEIKAAKMIIVNGCERMNTFLPLIIEVEEDMKFDEERRPICLSDSADNFGDSEELEVFGLGPRGKKLSTALFYPTQCFKRDVEEYTSCAKPFNASQGLCAGDFGGGAFTELNGRNTLVGIYADGNVNCDADPQTHPTPEFINVGFFAQAICTSTGICVRGTEHPTTTEDPVVYTPSPTESTTEEEYTDSPTEQPNELVETTDAPETEIIVAETFEKMKLQTCHGENEHYRDHVKNIHIHIHIDEDKEEKGKRNQTEEEKESIFF